MVHNRKPNKPRMNSTYPSSPPRQLRAISKRGEKFSLVKWINQYFVPISLLVLVAATVGWDSWDLGNSYFGLGGAKTGHENRNYNNNNDNDKYSDHDGDDDTDDDDDDDSDDSGNMPSYQNPYQQRPPPPKQPVKKEVGGAAAATKMGIEAAENVS